MSNILISTPPTSLATGLLQLDNGVAISSTPVYVADQNNTDSSLAISTNNIGIGTNNPTTKLQINGSTSSNFLKLALSSDVTQYFSAYLGSAPNLWDIGPVADDQNTILRFYRNNYALFRVGSVETMRIVSNKVGINLAGATPSAVLQAKGTGSTSATYSLLVQNSSSTQLLRIRDDNYIEFGGGSLTNYNDNSGVFNIWDARPNYCKVTQDAYVSTDVRVGKGNSLVATNTGLGKTFLNANTTGASNTAIGNTSMYTNTTGSFNVAVGDSSLYTSNADHNTGVGAYSLYANISGANNTALGSTTLRFNQTGTDNIAVGKSSLQSNISGNYNTAVGKEALYGNQTNSNNTAIGWSALRNVTSDSNTAIGYESSKALTTGNNNTTIGYQSLLQNTSGIYNVALGFRSLYVSSSGTNNTAIGSLNSALNSSGSNNVSVGYGAHYSNNTGSNNTLVGYNCQATNFDSCVVLGRDASANGSNQFVVGSASYNAGTVVAGANVSSQYWNVKINGVDYKILLA